MFDKIKFDNRINTYKMCINTMRTKLLTKNKIKKLFIILNVGLSGLVWFASGLKHVAPMPRKII